MRNVPLRVLFLLACACFPLSAGCFGSSAPGAPGDPSAETADAGGRSAARQEKIEIPVGTPVARVLKALGPADSTETVDGREVWRYTYKRAEYVYASNTGNVQTLVLGRYIADPQPESPGQALLLTIVFDGAKKVADFNFALMAY